MLYDPSKAKPVDAAGWILWNAADYIEAHGWCQGTIKVGVRVCAMGALSESIGDRNHVIAQDAVNRLTARVGTYVAQWNDDPGRTKEEVIAALRAAALAA